MKGFDSVASTVKDTVGTEGAVGGVAGVVVGVAVEIGVSEKEHVTCNYVFVHALAQESGNSDILER